MYMRNALVAAVGLQYLVEGILAQDKVTLTKTVTKRKSSSSVTAEEATEDITTVVPTSYITDGTTIWVDETITIPCSASACTATQTTGSVDAESTAETADAAGTSSESSVDGNVTEQTADITTVVPTSYITDGTTIFVDETITIPCSKCEASSTAEAESTAETADANTTAETADAASTSEPVDGNVTEQTADITTVVPTSYITDGTTIFVDETITIPCTKCEATETGAESTAETADANTTGAESTAETADANTTTETADAATSSLPVDDGNVTEQTADITTVVPTTYVTEGTTITEEQTITIPCTKCAATQTTGEAESTAIVPSGDNTAETSAASETQSVASSQDADGTTSAEETGAQTAGTASDDAETSTEVESTIPTSFSTNILSTGFGGSTATGPTGLFPNTSIAVETSAVASTILPEEPTVTTGEVKTSGTAVVSKIPKPVIVVIREVTIFHRTIVIGAACPPVKAGNSGNYIVGRDSEEKSFTEIGDALTDACNKQFKACSTIAGKNFRVADCQKQLTNCLADAASTAKAPTPVTKESTETASIILPSDATITGESKSYIGNGNVGPTATGETAVETTADAETTSAAESDAESTQDAATTEASEEVTGTQTGNVVTSITMTNSNGEVTVTAITLTTGQPTGTGVVSVPTGADSTQDVATTEATEEVTGTQGVESSAIVITMTKSDGEISVTSITLSTAGPSGTGAVSIPYGPGADETSVPAPEATDSSAIGQDTTAVPSGTNGVVTVTVGGNTDGIVTVTVGGNTDVVTQTVTAKVTETETVTVGCGANGSQSAATIISIVTTCPESTTLATATSTRVPETVYVTETVEFARQTATPDTPQRLRRMLGFSW
ncbi:hypothetical protein MRS44_008086 [Fusarium solani]|uniref:uncharacterized protein n=1 Tax=Fusarium solani TaxID=169388 RepID=UPI0032C3FC07|nr:hypothetical protein MRS44_008086 [Fusarium solani]